jgi:hypothetical protein
VKIAMSRPVGRRRVAKKEDGDEVLKVTIFLQRGSTPHFHQQKLGNKLGSNRAYWCLIVPNPKEGNRGKH